MPVDILSLILDQLKGPLLDQLKSLLGTDAEKTKKAVETAAGTILAGLLQKASTPGGAETLFNSLKSAAPSLPGADGGDVFGGLGDILGSPQKVDEISRKGTDLAGSIFGAGKASSILSILSSLLGLGSGITGKLLGLLMPLILGQISKAVLGGGGGGKGIGGLTEILLGQKDSLAKLGLPTNLLGELGINNFADLGKSISPSVSGAVRSAENAVRNAEKAVEGGLPGWLLPALLIGALALAGLYAARSCSPTEPVDTGVPSVEATAPSGTVAPPVVAPAPAVVEPMPATAPEAPNIELPKLNLNAITLPDGTKLDLPTGGLVDQLVSYINDPNRDPNKVFALDMASFAPGTANLVDSAKGLIELLAKVLNGYKSTNLKLTGYSDTTGTADEQQARSAALAGAIKTALEQLGIEPGRIEVEGKGAAPADSDRAKTGGVDISVTKF